MSSRVLKKENEKVVSGEDTVVSDPVVDAPELSVSKEKAQEKNSGSNELEELRRILVQPEEVGEVLPTAVRHSSQKTTELSEATLPIVEENIRQSVLRNPKVLAEALFPVIGPAIRKAISEALGSMVQSLNQTLEYSISPKGLRWRWEAFQTGKSFGEIVMLKTLLYRVEQVFLIHKKTGLLLQHVAADPQDIQDADMVSAMLTAIEDFVHDSFKASDDATLDSLKIKELSVWIENSPDAVIAGLIRGNPPLDLREVFFQAIEEIQSDYENELEEFDGNSQVFDKTRPILESCLQFQASEEERIRKRFFSPATVMAGVLGLLILIGGFFYVRDYRRWSGFIERLETENGIVVTEARRGWLTHSVSGLRDPLAGEPSAILSEYGYQTDDVKQNWKSYQDLSPAFVLNRANKILKPPKNIELKLENGVLTVSGDVSGSWLSEVEKIAPAIAGVNEFRITEEGLKQIKDNIESREVLFICNTTDLLDNQTGKLDNLAKDIDNLTAKTDRFDVEIHGFASNSGTEEFNEEISRLRAVKIESELMNRSENIRSARTSNAGLFKTVANGTRAGEGCKVKLKINLK
jgi:OOP family OmpA-OmpF porin